MPVADGARVAAWVALCDDQGRVAQVLRDDFDALPARGSTLAQMAAPGSLEKLLAFLTALPVEGALFDWSVNAAMGGAMRTLHLGGVAAADELLVLAGVTRAALLRAYVSLLALDPPALRPWRAALAQQLIQVCDEAGRDDPLYDDLSRLNNELVALQRELAQKNAALARLDEQKNRFLGMAAHDLRNPLQAILSYSEFLLEEAGDALSEEHRGFLDIIQSSSDFMLHLVNDLLDVSVIAAGELALDEGAVDLPALLRRNVALNQVLAAQRGVTVRVREVAELPLMWLDAAKIEQVLNNLLSNAIKYSPSPGTVEVTLARKSGRAELAVCDHGPGIPPDEVDAVFAMYARTSVKAGGGEKSTGLGLAITRNIVEKHGGEIWVESASGQGACFHVALPLDP